MLQSEELAKKIEDFNGGGQYEVKEVFVQQQVGFFKISRIDDLVVEDTALVRICSRRPKGSWSRRCQGKVPAEKLQD